MLIGIQDMALINITRVDKFTLFHRTERTKTLKNKGFLGFGEEYEETATDKYDGNLEYLDIDGKPQKLTWTCGNYDIMKSHLRQLISQLKQHDMDMVSQALENAMFAPEEKK